MKQVYKTKAYKEIITFKVTYTIKCNANNTMVEQVLRRYDTTIMETVSSIKYNHRKVFEKLRDDKET
jgi:hypothetical protein